jgi:hypothetical protein
MKHKTINEQIYRERECIHRDTGQSGDFYPGPAYLRQLQQLKGAEALSFASRVAPFFWSDAEGIIVWLCESCARQLGLIKLAEAPK